MNYNIRALILAVGAMLVSSAVIAAGAQAAEFTGFNTTTAKHEGGTIAGTQVGLLATQITTGISALRCNVATFSGISATGKDKALTITPSYFECEATTGNPITITRNNCDYIFNVGKEVTEGAHKGEFEGTYDIKNCNNPTEGVQTHILKADGTNKCTVDVEEQEGIGPIFYKNIGAAPNTEVQVAFEVHNLKTDATQGVLACGTSQGTHNEGSMFGTAIFKLTNGGGTQIDFTVM